MRFISLCSGIEAASVAWIPLDWQCVAVAEIEKFPCAVLKHHYPNVPNLGDVNLITQQQIEKLGHIDVVIFGFPCQDLSVAGKRKGLSHADGTKTRSGLFYKCSQIAEWSKARWVVAENVPGLFSSHEGRDFASVVGELAGAKIDVPKDGWRTSGIALGSCGLVEWRVLDAQYFGLAQRRKRVFLVLDTGDWSNRPPVLLVPESMSGDSPPRRTQGQTTAHDVAPCVGASGRGFSRGWDSRDQDAVVADVIPIQEIGQRQSGTSMNGVGHGNPGDPMYTLQAGSCHGDAVTETAHGEYLPTMVSNGDAHSGFRNEQGLVAHTLKAEHDASEDGTGRGVPLVPEVVGALTDGAHNGGGLNGQDAYTGRIIPTVQEEAWRQTCGCGHEFVGPLSMKCPGCGKIRDGETHGDPIVPEVSETLRAGGNQTGGDRPPGTDVDTADSLIPAIVPQAISYKWAKGSSGPSGPSGDEVANLVPEITPAITSNYGKQVDSSDTSKGPNVNDDVGAEPKDGIYQWASGGGNDLKASAQRLSAGAEHSYQFLKQGMSVRRLTPTECERLQGFPDNYTAIAHGKKSADQCPDGPRYKALGNSFAVPVVRWIGQRIVEVSKQ